MHFHDDTDPEQLLAFIKTLPEQHFKYTNVLECYGSVQIELFNRVTHPETYKEEPIEEEKTVIKRKPKPVEQLRAPKLWTEEETEALAEGLRKHGVGNWAIIHRDYSELFSKNGRTSKDLRDKWRGMKKKEKYRDILAAQSDEPK